MAFPIRSIVIIGSGNVAWRLGEAFSTAGIHIAHVAARDSSKAEELAKQIQCNSFSVIQRDLPAADLYLIAVRDDAISDVAHTINSHDRFLVHTAGAVSLSLLQYGNAPVGAIWPMQTLTRHNNVDLHQTLMAVTASDDSAAAALQSLASVITTRAVIVTEEQRSMLHLCAVWINNYTNHLFDIASQLLLENGLSMELFYPLIDEHISKLKTIPPAQLQTGPARRGDMATLAKHNKMLSQHPEWQTLYDAIAASIIRQFLQQ